MKGTKIRLELNNVQTTLARKHAGVSRHAYNWGLDVCQQAHTNGEKRPSAIDLHKKLVKEVKSVNAWYYEVSKCPPQEALRDLNVAYQRFFKGQGKFPQFKKKGVKDSFYLEGNIEAKDGKIKLPRFGWVKVSEKINVKGIKNVTVSRQASHWFVSFKTKEKPAKVNHPEGAVGVDLGIKTLATLSNEVTFENKRPYKKYKKKLKIEQRKLSKKYVKGQKPQSNNYYKQQRKVATIHYKISCLRKDTLHKLTTHLAKNHSEVVIEDLNVRGMSKNHCLASAILDGGFHEFRRQLTYKCEWYGSTLTVADRFFASSKTCSCCGHKKKQLKLSERTYKCDECHCSLDRDLNAALNLKKLAVSESS